MKNASPEETYLKEMAEKQDKITSAAAKRYQKLEGERKGARKSKAFDPGTMQVRRSIINTYDGLSIERILNKSDLFPIAHLQLGLNAGKSVCRISVRSRSGKLLSYGTGFMVSHSLMMTNNHVLNNEEAAQYSLAEFNFEDDEQFLPRQSVSFRLDPKRFFITDEKLDFTLVAVQEISNTVKLSDFGYLQLLSQEGKILEGEYVSIIQHPQGGMKAVTVRENEVRFLSDDFIHYVTDTEPGSSGSPVFNDQWVVVALHHAGIPDPKDKTKWIANEGVRISSIAKYLKNKRDRLDAIAISLVDELLGGNIQIGNDVVMDTEELSEDWYSKASGYDYKFLGDGFDVPMPELDKDRANDVVKAADGKEILNYTHFSVVMSKSRRLAFYTASNIDGKNRIELKRSGDKWYYDPRISKEYQCGPSLYSKNELDRGHLVRRLDPVWGSDADKANEDTFHFTNCSPQHKNLNQKTWLNLEDYILSNAAKHSMKVNVFTGPVFRSDDMVYRKEYKIPAEFWKVVVIVKDDESLSATAYLQTQKNLITNLEFAYGQYETYQVPVAQIEELTGLDFGKLREHDPMEGVEAAAFVIEGPESIRL
ncbi:DNA/RNA non-specific endonuclease [Youngiibacter multivorans]|uniref:Serine protease n=1 Tax=Youngiibacter multivorans TaxID=937251 RepID=A0ABS4G0Z9_9CLOT|nr:DNA/RNA non-specific endonuclease [Youngiibacter multivorans]MBP1918226.1 endonuclease G [Youngiibacter multivorans]